MSCGQSFDSLAAKETWMWIEFKLPEKVKLINGEKQEHHRLTRPTWGKARPQASSTSRRKRSIWPPHFISVCDLNSAFVIMVCASVEGNWTGRFAKSLVSTSTAAQTVCLFSRTFRTRRQPRRTKCTAPNTSMDMVSGFEHDQYSTFVIVRNSR